MTDRFIFLALALVSAAGCAWADSSGVSAVEVDGRTWTVYENFNISSGINEGNSLSDSGKSPLFIGTYNNSFVYAADSESSDRRGNVLGFVNDGERTFMLSDRITFRCKKKNPQCLSSDLQTRELAPGIYEVTVENLSDWKTALSVIASSPDVLRYEIIKDFGNYNEIN